MIKHLKIVNLNGFTTFDNAFYPDVNILTGINGSGKTSVLRLAWYVMSANIERVFDDCSFEHLEMETTQFRIDITPSAAGGKKQIVSVEYHDIENNTFKKNLPLHSFRREVEPINQFTVQLKRPAPTVMFPTFRRIEGGFSYLGQRGVKSGVIEDRQMKEPLEFGLQNLSRRLGVYMHHFVASISTSDIKNLLTQSYADVSRKTNEQHANLARDIADIVQKYNSTKKRQSEGHYIEQISKLVETISESQKKSLSAFETINAIVKDFIKAKSIQITPSLVFGTGEDVLDSDVLSAGEKQFLGFLAYNGLLMGGALFIDEPELSLHIDWQRRLLPTLRDQRPDNQLIIATHSPFIYSMYEDRELPFGEKK
jgi:predicted ATP-dependent endonuclease of OLD family